MKKISSLFGCMKPLLYAVLIQLIVVIIVTPFKPDAGVIEEPEFNLVIYAIYAAICIIIFGLWYKRNLLSNCTDVAKQRFSCITICFTVLLGLSLQVSISMLLSFLFMIKPEWFGQYDEVINQLGMGNSIVSFLYTGILAPISEELIFRGVILQKCKRLMPFLFANLVQALLFGIYHMNVIQGIYTFALGLLFGVLLNKYKTILAPILLHSSLNIGGILLGYITRDISTEAQPIIVIVMFIVSLLCLCFCIKKLIFNQGEKIAKNPLTI